MFVLCGQLMLSPALAYPTIVLTRDRPLADADRTSINRVWAVTGMLSPVRDPLSTVPRGTVPEREGVNAIWVPATGENTLFGAVD